MCNLIKNPSFEAGLSEWVTDNVGLDSRDAFEGTQAAVLNEGIASMHQDVSLAGTGGRPLLLSFAVLPDYPALVRPIRGTFVVEVIWLNGDGNPIGTGLRLLIPATLLTDNSNRLTYVEVTDKPPASAAGARLKFSKADLVIDNGSIIIDQIILTPLQDINLVTNSGFQARLFDWDSINSSSAGLNTYEGTNYAVLNTGGGTGIIFQDVPIGSLPPNSSFLLSFAARAGSDASDIMVTVEYRDNSGPLGTGLSLLVPASTLLQEGWKTYAVATETPAPPGATIARIQFAGTTDNSTVFIDKVILTLTGTPNLLLNPSFENGLNSWISDNVTATTSGAEYEGEQHARAGNSAYIFQDVDIGPEPGCCYLLTFAAQGSVNVDALAEVIWLNADGREIGLGTSIVIPEFALIREEGGQIPVLIWSLFASVTEPSPPDAVAARVRFSVASGSTMEIDRVSFTRIFCPPPVLTRGVKFTVI